MKERGELTVGGKTPSFPLMLQCAIAMKNQVSPEKLGINLSQSSRLQRDAGQAAGMALSVAPLAAW